MQLIKAEKMSRFAIAAFFSVLAILSALYVIFLGMTNPDTVGYPLMLTSITLFSIASYFVVMGAFGDVDEENAKKKV